MLINHTKSSLLYSKQNLITIQGTALLFLVMKTFKIYSLSNFRISNTAIWGGGGTPQHKILHRGLGWNPSPGRDRSHRSDNTRPLTCPRTATGEPLHYDQQAACYSPRDSFIYYPAFIFLHGVEKVLDAK